MGEESTLFSVLRSIQTRADLHANLPWLRTFPQIKLIEELKTILETEKGEIRYAAIEVLSELVPELAVEVFKLQLNDDEIAWRGYAISYFANLGDSKYKELMEDILRTEIDGTNRWICVTSLGEIGDLNSVSILSQILDNDLSEDFEGRKVSYAARLSISKIEERYR